MKGTVEVFKIVEGGKEELLYKEDNLVVNSAGQTIVDMLTTPSSTLGISPAVMDTSNWVVQAISFGKDASAYKGNAHAYPSRRNLFRWSTVSGNHPKSPNYVAGQTNTYYGNSIQYTLVSNTPFISPPPEYAHVPSSVAHVTRYTAGNVDYGQGILQYVWWSCYGGTAGACGSWDAGNPQLNYSAIDNNWVCASIYFKLDTDIPFYPNEVGSQRLLRVMVTAKGSYYYNPTAPDWSKYSQNPLDIAFKTNSETGLPTEIEPSSLFIRSTDTPREEGYIVSGWQPTNGVIDAGDGWYRAYVSTLTPSATSGIGFSISPKGIPYPKNTATGKLGASGAIYTYGWQIERGRYPTDLQFNSNHENDMWDMSGGVLGNVPPGLSTPSDAGTVRASGSYYSDGSIVSSYLPTNSLDTISRKYPDPLDYKLVTTDTKGNPLNTETPFDSSSVLSGLDMGQNLNMIPYRDQVGNLSSYSEPLWYSIFPEKVINGKTQYDWFRAPTVIEGALWDKDLYGGQPLSGAGSVGPQALTMGCYAEGSSSPAGGSRWVLVSSLDNSAAYGWYGENAMLSGVYDGGFNEASSMDALGYVGKVYNPIPNGRLGDSGNGVALSAYALIVSSAGTDINTADFNKNSKVTYECTISSGDCGMANLYGGITNIGLWTIDPKETIQEDLDFPADPTIPASNTITGKPPTGAPFDFNPLYPRKYRLFSSKKFIQNLTSVNDNIGAVNPAGALAYKDLKIRWTIDFGAAGNG
tara:strand:+ start:18331 stop:20577 length:2247 start_codon:yes stop_codon:yes gene_type:complete